MAKFKTSTLLKDLSGSFNRTDRTIGRPRALHAVMRQTRNGLILAKKPISVKNGSLAKKLRVSIYCSCDETYKTLTPSEIDELKLLHLQYNAEHRYKPVKLLYHFWMKLCMSKYELFRTNCRKITGNMYDVDMDTLKNANITYHAPNHNIIWPSINDDIPSLDTTFRGEDTNHGVKLYGSYGQTTRSSYNRFSHSILIVISNPADIPLNTRFIQMIDLIGLKITYTEELDEYYLESERVWPLLGVPTIKKLIDINKNHVIAISIFNKYDGAGPMRIFWDAELIAEYGSASLQWLAPTIFLHGIAYIRNVKLSNTVWTDEQIIACSNSLTYSAGG